MAGTFFVLSATSAQAASLNSGRYQLFNHPSGNVQPPSYGLRLDGLLDGDQNKTFTFDFNDSRSSMFLDYNAQTGTINISGKVWGGLDEGTTYQNPELWEVNFTYKNVTSVSGDDDVWVKKDYSGTNKGTITRLSDGKVFNLEDEAGNFPYSFRFGDEDDDKGHRDYKGISGWGWLNHAPAPNDPNQHLYDSDWIFTAKQVPEPTSVLGLLAIGALGAGSLRKKKQDA
jgi:hypothetical protein